jgi:YVTN family beta-propeller protein
MRIPDSIDPSSGEIVVIDTTSDIVRTTLPLGENPISLAVTRDRSKVYVSSYRSAHAYVIDPASNTITTKFNFSDDTSEYLFRPMVVTPDGRKLYELNGDNRGVSVVDVATDRESATIAVGERPDDLTLTADGARLYVANRFGNSVSVIDTARDMVTATIAVDTWPSHVLVAPDGGALYVGHFSNAVQVSVIDTASNRVAAKIALGGWFCFGCAAPDSMSVTPDGRKLYVAVPESKYLSVIDTAKREVVGTIAVGVQKLEANSMAMTPDGRTLYMSPGSGTLSVINTASDKVVATLPIDGTLSLTPDGKKVYAVGNDDVTVIDTASNKIVAKIPVGGFGKMAFVAAPGRRQR